MQHHSRDTPYRTIPATSSLRHPISRNITSATPIAATPHVAQYLPGDLNTTRNKVRYQLLRPEKSQNESSPNFSNLCPGFCPEFLSEFSPNFLRSFRASFRGKRRPEKIHQKSPPFFNAKFPGKYVKNIHKMFLERTQSNNSWHLVSHRHSSATHHSATDCVILVKHYENKHEEIAWCYH